MKTKFIVVGKTEEYLQKGILNYENRLKHYLSYSRLEIPALRNTKNMKIEEQKMREGETILKYVDSTDFVILLDERGAEYSSEQFAIFMEKMMISRAKNILFVAGGPFGFSESVIGRANQTLSLSKLTFSHQMVRLFFIEQLYRAMTILKNVPYHHV